MILQQRQQQYRQPKAVINSFGSEKIKFSYNILRRKNSNKIEYPLSSILVTVTAVFMITSLAYTITTMIGELTMTTTPNNFGLNHPKSRFEQEGNYDDDDDKDNDGTSASNCPIYGCPMYPLELSLHRSHVQYTVNELMKESKEQSFATKTTFGTLTQQSNSHHTNQDMAVIIDPFRLPKNRYDASSRNSSHNSSYCFLIALMDGHGVDGHVIAQYVAKELPKIFYNKLRSHFSNDKNNQKGNSDKNNINNNESSNSINNNSDNIMEENNGTSSDWISTILNETLYELNENAPPVNALLGGCTVSITFKYDDTLYFANVGDSRTILVHAQYNDYNNTKQQQITKNDHNDSNVTVPYMTRLDKAHVDSERKRIESYGGRIFGPTKKFPHESRVNAYSAAAKPPETIGLSMSRSIGDWEWKAIGVIPEPTIHTINISKLLSDTSNNNYSKDRLFILAASDGVWETRSNNVNFFANYFYKSIVRNMEHPFVTCYNLINAITPKNVHWYRDDMTILYIEVAA